MNKAQSTIHNSRFIIKLIGYTIYMYSALCVTHSASVSAQNFLFPLNRDYYNRVEPYINSDSIRFHTAMKPLTFHELTTVAPVDSVFSPIVSDKGFFKTWLGRKIFKEHLFEVNEDGIHFSVDPIFNFELGRDTKNDNNLYVNTRGLLIQGDVSQKFFFYTGFHENQAKYVNYISAFVDTEHVVPGQGRVKYLPEHAYDFNSAYGGVGYTLGRHFDFLLAHDKIFIGDGYRSLLLSDNAFNYPFFRINANFWRIKYSVIYTAMQNLKDEYVANTAFKKKYVRASYLDIVIGRKNQFSFGLFESVIWGEDYYRSFEINYLNPVIFLRPVENSLGSPDNELLGVNLKYKINSRNIFYGQLMIDELLLSEVRSGKGWWGNKQAFQVGYKSYSIFKVKNLNIQTEFNFVRPFTYQHDSNGRNYQQYNQPLAHPLGANFIESVSFINYRWKNFFVETKFNYSIIGKDKPGENNGNYVMYDYTDRTSDYGHYMFSGIRTTLTFMDARIAYLVNPKTNWNIELGMSNRNQQDDFQKNETRYFYFGMRTALQNLYHDF